MQTVGDVMTREVRTVRTDEVIGPIRDLMLDGELHGVPVLDHDGGLVGIVTASDLVEEWAPEQGVVTVMSDRVRTVTATTTVTAAAREMVQHHLHHLVVLESGDVAGVVSSFDLLRVLAHTVEQAPKKVTGRARAEVGDHLVIRGHQEGRPERRAIIVQVRGEDGTPPYVVRWLDDPHDEPHDVLFFPGSDADIEHPTADSGTA